MVEFTRDDAVRQLAKTFGVNRSSHGAAEETSFGAGNHFRAQNADPLDLKLNDVSGL
jgi:hypothetical protein